MSKTSVKKALKNLEREALQELILEMYTARKEARNYLEFWADPDIDRELDSAKGQITKSFYMSAEHPRRKPGLKDIKEVIKNFATFCPEPEKMADLMLFYPEMLIHWLMDRRGIGMVSNKTPLYKAIDNAAAYIEQSAIEEQYAIRLERLRATVDQFYEVMPDLVDRRGRMNRYLYWKY